MPECSKCGKAFDTQSTLNNHSQVHRKDGQDIEFSLSTTHYVIGGIALLLIAGVVFGNPFSGGMTGNAAHAAGGSAPAMDNTYEPSLGPSDAPVKIAYFGDYGCPSCRAFEQRVFPQLKAQLIDTGKVRFVKKNFPVVTRQSPMVAQASQAVWNQVKEDNPDAFWAWHETIYRNQRQATTQQSVLQLTGQVDGINVDTVRTALSRGTYRQEVQDDLSEGQQAGVRGTPTFIIYNPDTGASTKIVGPQPVSRFQNVVQQVQ